MLDHLDTQEKERKTMKRFLSVLALCAAVMTGAVEARHQEITPVPEVPMSVESAPYVDAASAGVPLFTRVRYKDLDEMACCTEPKIISVKDPCACDDGCCPPPCVYIQICVPTCGCELVSCRRNGDRIRYDYGKYAVDVRVKRGFIEVDYQD
jgi:hypothetical protein